MRSSLYGEYTSPLLPVSLGIGAIEAAVVAPRSHRCPSETVAASESNVVTASCSVAVAASCGCMDAFSVSKSISVMREPRPTRHFVALLDLECVDAVLQLSGVDQRPQDIVVQIP